MSGQLRYTPAVLVRPWTASSSRWYEGGRYSIGSPVLVEWAPGRQWARVYERTRNGGAGFALFRIPLSVAPKWVKSIGKEGVNG